MINTDFAIVGAGLAGCECALKLASQGFSATIFEQKPLYRSAAHTSNDFAELVCSNSFRSNDESSGIGLLKAEMRALNSHIMAAADACAIPAGKALAVDREAFSGMITEQIRNNPNIALVQKRMDSLDEPALKVAGTKGIVIAAGPLASEGLAESLAGICGEGHCYFYDAIAPIIWTDSLDMDIVFRASRYADSADDADVGDYFNCPFSREEYEAFHAALCGGKVFNAAHGDTEKHFEGCMPIEALAARGERTLTFGPLKPVGLVDPRTGKRPWAVLQLRPEKSNRETCNLVGCQTKLLHSEQERIFQLVPGLSRARFARFGSMHRNTYINSPRALNHDLSLRNRPGIYLAGQITGVEGYVESAASGLWLGIFLGARARGEHLPPLPPESALGALLAHLRRPCKNFQPSNAHFGLMPELGVRVRKKERKELYAQRAVKAFAEWLQNSRI